ncbi:MAG: hypothetical protein ACNA8W_12205, partial [Bradymonadaceae bacterium]
MWKRFIKFFKGTDEPPDNYDGGYLDHLLETIQPRVAERLDECSTHDPLLLVVAEILLEAVPNIWQAEYNAPLIDDLSPGFEPPPPPPLDTTMEAEVADEIEADEIEADEIEEIEEAEDADESDSEVEAVPIDASSIEEISEASDFKDGDSEDLEGFVNPLDETAEFVAASVPPLAEDIPDGSLRLDSTEVLRAGRVLINMLINNDRLPLEQQLTVGETLLACDLWVGYMVSAQGLESKSQKLLRLVEEKFAEGSFGQARLLLQLFQTDRSTRLNNDRNLFYEDMILRMGIKRKYELSKEGQGAIQSAWKEACVDDDASLRFALDTMAGQGFIHSQFFAREPHKVAAWRELAEKCTRPSAVPYFLSHLPPRRWRDHTAQPDRPVLDLLTEHVARPMIRAYVLTQLKACYFILRAVGDTGLEEYLDGFFDWAGEFFDYDVPRMMPEVYQRTMMGFESTSLIFQDLFDKYFKVGVERVFAEIEEDRLRTALEATIDMLAECDYNEIAPGNYDFGALIVD